MTYKIEDVRRAILNYDAPSEAAFFRLLLLNAEAVKLGDLGYAFIVQEQEEERGYYNEGPLYYVFKLVDADRNERFFKVDGNYTSYDGAEYYAHNLVEVQPAPVQRVTWAAI
ncbi:hypothetical protein JRC04_05495 [Mycolicibacterium sp. S2-37]|uniref:hypothetical protein n=1 Tax=Mycolicibacterium sp. S2-37 TaxID=2810297 RepID=UPI001A93C33C|nr:hypothetical protein [Mycolicibacterium sp. S2-37]MBO0676910.1 hypothetical protein [Mycolicibacterium sp. S2-37]